MSKVRSIVVRKDETRRMEEEAKRMEAKLEVLRRTMDEAEKEAKSRRPSGAPDGGRWRSASATKPLTRGYVSHVLEAQPARRAPGAAVPSGLGSKPRSPSTGPAVPASDSAAATPSKAPRDEAFSFSDLGKGGGASPLSGGGSPYTALPTSSKAGLNLQAAMQQQSRDALEVEAFLCSLKLERYVSLFMEHGFDCMDVVRDMQETHMRDLGMAAGHILKLRKWLAEMNPQRAASSPVSHVAAAAPGISTGKAEPAKHVSFGKAQEVLRPVEDSSSAAGRKLSEGQFSEEESAASFQEALRAWREGRADSASSSAGQPASAPAASPKKAAGSFWASVGESVVDLTRAGSTETAAVGSTSPTQKDPAPGDEKLCCYHCYKQFYARFAVERECKMPEYAGGGRKRLCSEACANLWVAAMEAKAEAMQKRQEKLQMMQEMQRSLAVEQSGLPQAPPSATPGKATELLP